MVTSAVLYSIGTSFIKHGVKHTGKLERFLVWISFTIVLLAVNISRLFIATHFPHQVVAGSITGTPFSPIEGILLAEVVKHEHTSHLSFRHYVVWSLLLVSGVFLTYTGITFLGLDPLWSLSLARKWCTKSEWVHPDTTPFFAFVRDISSLIGFCVGVLLSGNPRIRKKLSMGQKLVHVGMSLLFTLTVENIKIFSTSSIFYVVGFLKFTTMMVGVAYIIPQLLNRNKIE